MAGPRISKFELLTMFRDELLRRGYRQFSNFEITPVDEFVIDRSLDDELFRKLYGLNKKSWLTMLREMLGEERL